MPCKTYSQSTVLSCFHEATNSDSSIAYDNAIPPYPIEWPFSNLILTADDRRSSTLPLRHKVGQSQEWFSIASVNSCFYQPGFCLLKSGRDNKPASTNCFL